MLVFGTNRYNAQAYFGCHYIKTMHKCKVVSWSLHDSHAPSGDMGAVEILQYVTARLLLLPDSLETLGFSLLDLKESGNIVSLDIMRLTPLSTSYSPTQSPPTIAPHPINAPIYELNLEFFKLYLHSVPSTGDDWVR